MNNVILIGRLTRDVDLRYTQSGTAVARFTVAIDRHDKDNNADFPSCIAFGKTAELMSNYVRKGQRVALEGRIQTGSYTNSEGKTIYTTDIVASRVEFIESKQSNEGYTQPQQGYTQPRENVQPNYSDNRSVNNGDFNNVKEDDLPF